MMTLELQHLLGPPWISEEWGHQNSSMILSFESSDLQHGLRCIRDSE